MNRRPLPLVICLLVPFVILISGLSFAVWQGYEASRVLLRENGRGTVPPGFSADLAEPGKHTLWLHTRTVFEGQSHASPERLAPGARVALTDEATGKPLTLNPYGGASKSLGSERAVSVGTFETHAPARITIVGTGFPESVVLSVAPSKLREVMKTVVQVGGTVALTLLSAILTLIVLLHRRQKAMQAEHRMHE